MEPQKLEDVAAVSRNSCSPYRKLSILDNMNQGDVVVVALRHESDTGYYKTLAQLVAQVVVVVVEGNFGRSLILHHNIRSQEGRQNLGKALVDDGMYSRTPVEAVEAFLGQLVVVWLRSAQVTRFPSPCRTHQSVFSVLALAVLPPTKLSSYYPNILNSFLSFN